MSSQIKDFDSLLRNENVIGITTSQLTTAGDNYASLILGVDITIKNDSEERQIRTVAKQIPQNPFIQHMFNTQKTFRNEVGFYQTIMPCLKQFQKDQGLTNLIDSSPEFIAARLSLNPFSTTVDEDAILLIKNLKDDGFQIIDKKVAFDLDQSKIILEKVAELHATTMALKSLKPEIFADKLQPFLEEFTVFDAGEEGKNQLFKAILDSIKNGEICAQNIQKIETNFAESSALQKKNNKELHRSLFLGLIHGDLWANNIMVKIENNKITDVKFVDFQLYEYSCLAKDIIFFLFTSVQIPVLEKHCDELLTFYYESLIKQLKALKYDTSHLNYQAFFDDMGFVVNKGELLHILLMLAPIYGGREDALEVEEVNQDNMVEQRDKLSLLGQQRAYFIIREFVQRDWLTVSTSINE